MPTIEHKLLEPGDVHIPFQWSYADATAREAGSGFITADLGKLSRQESDNTLWMLTATTPTWTAVGGGASGSTAWIDPVADITARDAIVTTGFTGGETVAVNDDGDGKAAIYTWNTSAWVKISDIDWEPVASGPTAGYRRGLLVQPDTVATIAVGAGEIEMGDSLYTLASEITGITFEGVSVSESEVDNESYAITCPAFGGNSVVPWWDGHNNAGATAAAFSTYAADEVFIGQDFGAGNEKTVNKIVLQNGTSTTHAAKNPTDFRFQASATGAWGGEEVTLHTHVGNDWTQQSNQVLTYEFENTTAYRYYRFVVDDIWVVASNQCYIYDLALIESGLPGLTADTTHYAYAKPPGAGSVLTVDELTFDANVPTDGYHPTNTTWRYLASLTSDTNGNIDYVQPDDVSGIGVDDLPVVPDATEHAPVGYRRGLFVLSELIHSIAVGPGEIEVGGTLLTSSAQIDGVTLDGTGVTRDTVSTVGYEVTQTGTGEAGQTSAFELGNDADIWLWPGAAADAYQDFGAGNEQMIINMRFRSSIYSTHTPKHVALYGSATGAFAGEETLIVDIPELFPSDGPNQVADVDITNTNSYRYYWLRIFDTWTGGTAQANWIELNADVYPTLAADTDYYVYVKPPGSGNVISVDDLEFNTDAPTDGYHPTNTTWRYLTAILTDSSSELTAIVPDDVGSIGEDDLPVVPDHELTAPGDIHVPFQWSYADSTAREAGSGFVAADLGKLARQEDDNTLWLLSATTPTWVQVGGGAGGGPTFEIIRYANHAGGTINLTQSSNVMLLLVSGNLASNLTFSMPDYGTDGVRLGDKIIVANTCSYAETAKVRINDTNIGTSFYVPPQCSAEAVPVPWGAGDDQLGWAVTSIGSQMANARSWTTGSDVGVNSISVGYANTVGANAVAIGGYTVVAGNGSVAIGDTAETLTSGVAIGYDANATGANGVSIGNTSRAAQNSTSIGWYADASAQDAVAVGKTSTISGDKATGVGALSKVSGAQSLFVGAGLGGGVTLASNYSIVVGNPQTCHSGADYSINIGHGTVMGDHDRAIIMGRYAKSYFADCEHLSLAASANDTSIRMVLSKNTTDDTPLVMDLASGAAPVIPTGAGFMFDFMVGGYTNGSENGWLWNVKGMMAGSTLVGVTITNLGESTVGTDVAVTNSGYTLNFTVTGLAATNIYWRALGTCHLWATN